MDYVTILPHMNFILDTYTITERKCMRYRARVKKSLIKKHCMHVMYIISEKWEGDKS